MGIRFSWLQKYRQQIVVKFICLYTFSDMTFQDTDDLILFTKIDVDYQSVVGYVRKVLKR